MNSLYITADNIGTPTGGGSVTFHESNALASISSCKVLSREFLTVNDPLAQDEQFCRRVEERIIPDNYYGKMHLAHAYAGCLSNTIRVLNDCGVKTVYTCAAHDKDESRIEHQKMGIPFDYPHLTNPELWREYLRGYLEADVLVVPSTYSKKVIEQYGRKGRIEIIPHGVDLPETIAPLPSRFTVGYLGAMGPDKGLIYLMQAWKKLNYKDATLKIAGKFSTDPYIQHLLMVYGVGNVELCGWVKNISDFYNSISLYVQASVSEGYGIEVLESLAHGRAVVCSRGAGVADLLMDRSAGLLVNARDVDGLAGAIDLYKSKPDALVFGGKSGAEQARGYTWEKIRDRYVTLWRSLVHG